MPRRTPPRGPKGPPTADDPVRAQNVLVEEMRSHVKLLAEHIDLRVDGLERKLDDSTKALRGEIIDLRSGVTQNSEAIRMLQGDVRQNSEDIRKLQGDVRQNSADIRTLQNAVTTHSAEIRGLRGDLGGLRRDFEEARQ